MPRYKNITLTPDQELFVRENYKTMTQSKMAKHFKISQGKVQENMVVMGLKKKVKRPTRAIVIRGFFNEVKYGRENII